MSENLLTSGFVQPKNLPLEQLRIEICQFLQIPLKNLERLELWPHQIWIKFFQGRGKFLSYRQLPLWLELGLKAIRKCCNSNALKQLGQIFLIERDWFNHKREFPQQWQQTIETWRQAWAEKAIEIKTEEERTRPQREHQQKAEQWLSGWQQVISFCQDCQSLDRLAEEMEIQSEEFKDLPQILRGMRQILQQRWQELGSENRIDCLDCRGEAFEG
ncbi:MAG: hypothetical protein WA919_20070 [Coleofasciculaceae cyanobacterium]